MSSFSTDPKDSYRCCISVAAQRGFVHTSPGMFQSAYRVELMSPRTVHQNMLNLIYTDIEKCRYVDNRNHGLTKDCSLDHGSAIKDDSYSL